MKCPKCGKRIAGRVNFCPYCGYKDENGAMGGGKRKSLKEKIKNMPPEKKKKLKLATIITSVSLVVLIVVITLAVTLSSIFRLAKVKKVELGMTKAQVEKILGKPNDIDDAYVPVAGGDIDVYVYYESKVAKILKEIDKNADSDVDDWDDLDKALEKEEKLYNKLEKMKYKSIVIGFDRSYERVISIAFNKQTKYSKSNPYNSWGTKTISDFSLNKQTLALHEDLSAGDFYYTATYKDGSYRKECIYRLSGFSTEAEGRKTVEFDNDWATKQLNLEVKTANVVVESSNANWGNVKGTGFYVNGQTVALTATPYYNYTFDGWYQGDTLVSRDNPYSFKYTPSEQVLTYTARFSAIDWSKAIGFENLNVEQSSEGLALLSLKDNTITEIIIPSGVTTIVNGAFSGCSSVTSITLPSTIRRIGGYLWENYDDAGFGRNSRSIFEACNNLVSISVDEQNSNFSSQDGVLYNKAKTYIYCVPKAASGIIHIPDGITNIDRYVFNNHVGLTSVVFGENSQLTAIDDHTFSECTGLSTIIIPNRVTRIGERAFWNCTSLTSITIPNSVTSIGDKALYGCDGLTSVTIGNSVTSIGREAFVGCQITNVNVFDLNAWCNIAFEIQSCPLSSTTILTVNGARPSGDIVLQSAKAIPCFTFYNCTDITSITLPTECECIEKYAFYGCTGLTSLVFPTGITSIEEYAFYGCTGLTAVTIPNSAIGGGAFANCDGLISVMISNSATGSNSSFSGCTHIENVVAPSVFACSIAQYSHDSIRTITITAGQRLDLNNALGCPQLTTFQIPDSIESISDSGSNIFAHSNNLQYTIYDNAKYLGNENNPYVLLVEAINDEITSCVINDNCKIICHWALASPNLTTINIPKNITGDLQYAFGGRGLQTITVDVNNLKYSSVDGVLYNKDITKIVYVPLSIQGNITIPYGVTKVGPEFSGRENITSITFHESCKLTTTRAFSGCSSLTSIILPKCDGISEREFDHCDLISIDIPDGAKYISEYAFLSNENLISVTIPNSVKLIRSYAFCFCKSLTSITFNGTKNEWNNVSKGLQWDNNTGNYVIHCTDGDISKGEE